MADAMQIPLKTRLIAWLLLAIKKALSCTYRVSSFRGREIWESLLEKKAPVIICHWHNRIFYFASAIENQLVKRGFRVAMMSSLSKDGEIGALLGRMAGAHVVRGSSSREGTRGVRALYRASAKENFSLIILPDGSQGPVYEAKMGVVVLAQLTGNEIIPMSYAADRYWRIKSWDRLIIPKPFAKIAVAVGKPISIARDARPEELETHRQRVQETLMSLDGECKATVSKK